MHRRYNYTTPKSFLELLALYRAMLARKREELAQAKQRLETGVDRVAQVRAAAGGGGWGRGPAPATLPSVQP